MYVLAKNSGFLLFWKNFVDEFLEKLNSKMFDPFYLRILQKFCRKGHPLSSSVLH